MCLGVQDECLHVAGADTLRMDGQGVTDACAFKVRHHFFLVHIFEGSTFTVQPDSGGQSVMGNIAPPQGNVINLCPLLLSYAPLQCLLI